MFRLRKNLKKGLTTLFLCSALVMTGCASQQTTDEYGPPVPAPSPTPPADPTAGITPTPLPDENAGAELPKDAPPRVTLVVGGAGVASFATVGILKRFAEEGIRVDMIVTTGWPTLFALGYGFMKSVHDLEWFAMRLQEKDFYSAGVFDTNKDFEDHDELSRLIKQTFQQKELGDSRVRLVISAENTDLAEPEVYDSGDWKTPLLKTMSVPGIYRPYPEKDEGGGISSLQGIDVEEAVKRGSQIIVAVEMYDDYFNNMKKARKPSSDAVFRKLYISRLKSDMTKQLKQAQVVGRIDLNKAPGDFTQKRLALVAGYKEGVRLAKLVRPLLKK